MFKASSTPTRPNDKNAANRSPFGPKKPSPRLESAFIFPAGDRPRGVSIDGGRKSEKPIPKKL